MNILKMRYSIEPGDRIYVKKNGFLSFAKNIGNKYGQKLFNRTEKATKDVIKIASKKAIQKTAEATGDLIGNKIAYKITSISKTPTKELPINDEDAEITTRKKDICDQKKDKKLLMN